MEHLIAAHRLKADLAIAQCSAKFLKPAPPFIHTMQRGLLPDLVHVPQQLAGASKAGETGIFYTGPGGMGAALKHQYTGPRMAAFVMQCREQARDACPNHRQPIFATESGAFPNAEHAELCVPENCRPPKMS